MEMVMVKKWSKNSLLYLIITIFAAIGFIITAYVGLKLSIIPRWSRVALSAIPMIIFGLFYVLSLKRFLHGSVAAVLSVVLAIVLFFGGIINGFFIIIEESLTTISDKKYYEKVLDNYGYPDSSIKFFPPDIPKNALKAEFYEIPQFLQGGSMLYLFLELKQEDYQKTIETLSKNATNNLSINDISLSGDKDGYYITNGFINPFSLAETSGKWIYYIYENQKEASGEGWNHGKIAGVAANSENNWIIYYYERW